MYDILKKEYETQIERYEEMCRTLGFPPVENMMTRWWRDQIAFCDKAIDNQSLKK